jgi:hypothetical protein
MTMGLFFFTVFTPFSEFAGFQKTGGRGGREIFFSEVPPHTYLLLGLLLHGGQEMKKYLYFV